MLALASAPRLALPRALEDALGSISLEAAAVSPSTSWRVWKSVVRATRPLLIRSAAISFAASTCAACSTLLAMRILEPGQALQAMLVFSLGYFASNGLSMIAVYGSNRTRAWAGLTVETHLVSLISRKLSRLSSLAAARQSSGNLKTLITSDTKSVGTFLDNAVRNLIPSLMALLVVTPLLWHFSGKAGLIGIGVMTTLLPFALTLTTISSRIQAKSQAELDRLTTLVGEWVKNIRLVRSLSWDEAFESAISGGVRRFLKFSVAVHFLACLIFGFSTTWWMLSVLGVVASARWLALPLDLTGFFGSLWLLTFLAGYFTHLPNTIRLLGEAMPSIRRIARLLGENEQNASLADGPPLDPGVRPFAIRFEDVSFSYPSGREVIRGLSGRVSLASKVAIIGEVGAGKTTLLKLICGELPPTRGRILVELEGGALLDLWSRPAHEALRRHVAYVPQEPFVSSDRLGANITLADEAAPEHDERRMVESAYWAELEADIAAFPHGIAQEIGESGINLSGGQRQRLNLARARFAHRDFLVLDDTLSAVDTRTETLLMERLAALGGGFVLVTHRTRELMRVDHVMVIQDGRIAEQGAPSELASRPGSLFLRVMRAYEARETSEEPVDE